MVFLVDILFVSSNRIVINQHRYYLPPSETASFIFIAMVTQNQAYEKKISRIDTT